MRQRARVEAPTIVDPAETELRGRLHCGIAAGRSELCQGVPVASSGRKEKIHLAVGVAQRHLRDRLRVDRRRLLEERHRFVEKPPFREKRPGEEAAGRRIELEIVERRELLPDSGVGDELDLALFRSGLFEQSELGLDPEEVALSGDEAPRARRPGERADAVGRDPFVVLAHRLVGRHRQLVEAVEGDDVARRARDFDPAQRRPRIADAGTFQAMGLRERTARAEQDRPAAVVGRVIAGLAFQGQTAAPCLEAACVGNQRGKPLLRRASIRLPAPLGGQGTARGELHDAAVAAQKRQRGAFAQFEGGSVLYRLQRPDRPPAPGAAQRHLAGAVGDERQDLVGPNRLRRGRLGFAGDPDRWEQASQNHDRDQQATPGDVALARTRARCSGRRGGGIPSHHHRADETHKPLPLPP